MIIRLLAFALLFSIALSACDGDDDNADISYPYTLTPAQQSLLPQQEIGVVTDGGYEVATSTLFEMFLDSLPSVLPVDEIFPSEVVLLDEMQASLTLSVFGDVQTVTVGYELTDDRISFADGSGDALIFDRTESGGELTILSTIARDESSGGFTTFVNDIVYIVEDDIDLDQDMLNLAAQYGVGDTIMVYYLQQSYTAD